MINRLNIDYPTNPNIPWFMGMWRSYSPCGVATNWMTLILIRITYTNMNFVGWYYIYIYNIYICVCVCVCEINKQNWCCSIWNEILFKQNGPGIIISCHCLPCLALLKHVCVIAGKESNKFRNQPWLYPFRWSTMLTFSQKLICISIAMLLMQITKFETMKHKTLSDQFLAYCFKIWFTKKSFSKTLITWFPYK